MQTFSPTNKGCKGVTNSFSVDQFVNHQAFGALGGSLRQLPTIGHPGDTKRVFVGQLSADKPHSGVSQAANELGNFWLTVSNLELFKLVKRVQATSSTLALGRLKKGKKATADKAHLGVV